jgi:hypothetical protein
VHGDLQTIACASLEGWGFQFPAVSQLNNTRKKGKLGRSNAKLLVHDHFPVELFGSLSSITTYLQSLLLMIKIATFKVGNSTVYSAFDQNPPLVGDQGVSELDL